MNSYTIVFSPEALKDLKDAAAWYNKQQKGLGKRLRADIKNVIAAILINPFFASVKYENIRTAACKVFPYSVHYEVSEAENIVRVLSVFHFSRKPTFLSDGENE